ncbi:MAG: permease [candidate division WOR-3 bacterium]
MEIIIKFLMAFKDYFIEVLPSVGVGFLLSGIIHEFIPQGWVEKTLGGKRIRPIIYLTLSGVILPLCCFGSLPVAVSLHKKGVKLGPILAFLVATPATSIPALLVTYALLGIKFAVFIFFAVIIISLVIGLFGNLIDVKNRDLSSQNLTLASNPSCAHCEEKIETNSKREIPPRKFNQRLKCVFRHSFVDLPKEIGPELLLGLALAALIVIITPIGKFIEDYFGGVFGYLFSLVFGVVMYICATGSVPLVHAFISQGMNIGAGMVLLIVGPVTSWGTLLVLRKEFGIKILLTYLTIISILALCLGTLFSKI